MADPFTFVKRPFKSKYSNNDDSDSESEHSSEDEELLNPSKKKKPKRQTTSVHAVRVTAPPKSPNSPVITTASSSSFSSTIDSTNAESTHKAPISIVLSDDSDDEDDVNDIYIAPDANPEQRAIWEQISSSRSARSALYTSLLTKVVDEPLPPEVIETNEDSDDEPEELDNTLHQTTQATMAEDTGPKIQIKLRVGDEQAKAVMMAMKRPFSALKTTWCSAHGYSESDVSFHFDGDVLDLSETPEDQDLEGGEIIDVRIKPGAKKQGGEDTGPKIQIKLRVGDEQAKVVMMAMKRPFSALKTTWCSAHGYSESDVSFHFDGDVLDLSETPEDQDLEGGEIIDVRIKPGAVKKSPSSVVTSSVPAVAPPKMASATAVKSTATKSTAKSVATKQVAPSAASLSTSEPKATPAAPSKSVKATAKSTAKSTKATTTATNQVIPPAVSLPAASDPVPIIVSVHNGKKKQRLKINSLAPLQGLFTGYVASQKISDHIASMSFFECNKKRLDLSKSAADQGLTEAHKILFKTSK